jgi:hypothetical protein
MGVTGDLPTETGFACSNLACCNSSTKEPSSDTSEASGLDWVFIGSTTARRFVFRAGLSGWDISKCELAASTSLVNSSCSLTGCTWSREKSGVAGDDSDKVAVGLFIPLPSKPASVLQKNPCGLACFVSSASGGVCISRLCCWVKVATR